MSQSSLEKLHYITDELNSNLRVMHEDFLKLLDIIQVNFARNIYGRYDNWSYRPDFKFDFEYAQSHNSTNIFQDIRAKVNNFCKKFFLKRKPGVSIPEKKTYSKLEIKLYETFIQESMSDLITNVCDSISCNFPDYTQLVSRYKHLKKQNISKKINYDVLNKIKTQITII